MTIPASIPRTSSSPEPESVAGMKGRVRLQKNLTIDSNSFQGRRNAAWIEMERRNLQVYEYLCHIGEAKDWIEACIKEEIASIDMIEEGLRDGVTIAKLARIYEPTSVKKIFEDPRIQYRHSDNINFFLAAIRKIGLPENFHFELTDLYGRKNLPRVIYCIHALGHLLFQQGRGPRMNNLVGKLRFSEEQLRNARKELDKTGAPMPTFECVEAVLSQELQKLQVIDSETRELTTAKSRKLTYHSQKDHSDCYKMGTDSILAIQSRARGIISRRLFRSKLEGMKQAGGRKNHLLVNQIDEKGRTTTTLAYLEIQGLSKYKIVVSSKESSPSSNIYELMNHQDCAIQEQYFQESKIDETMRRWYKHLNHEELMDRCQTVVNGCILDQHVERPYYTDNIRSITQVARSKETAFILEVAETWHTITNPRTKGKHPKSVVVPFKRIVDEVNNLFCRLITEQPMITLVENRSDIIQSTFLVAHLRQRSISIARGCSTSFEIPCGTQYNRHQPTSTMMRLLSQEQNNCANKPIEHLDHFCQIDKSIDQGRKWACTVPVEHDLSLSQCLNKFFNTQDVLSVNTLAKENFLVENESHFRELCYLPTNRPCALTDNETEMRRHPSIFYTLTLQVADMIMVKLNPQMIGLAKSGYTFLNNTTATRFWSLVIQK